MSALFRNALGASAGTTYWSPAPQAFFGFSIQAVFLLCVLLWATFSLFVSSAIAAPYGPGETLDPSCSPGATNCTVLQLSVATSTYTFGVGTTSPFAKFSIHASSTESNRYLFAIASSTASATTTQLVFTNLGNLGIGTTSPGQKISVAGDILGNQLIGSYFTATSTTATSTFAGGMLVGGGAFKYDFSSGITSADDLQVGPMTFDTNAGAVAWIDLPVTSTAVIDTIESYSARIDGNSVLTVYGESDGSGGTQNRRVGVATTSPWRTFSVSGTVGFSSSLTSATTGNYLCINTTTYQVTSGTTCSASSERFKENIQTLSYGLEAVKKLQPVTFTYKKEFDPNPAVRVGFIAEQVREVIPELVPLDKDGNPEAVDYAKFVAVLTKAIQEQQVQIDALKSGGGFSVSSTLSAISDSLNATLAQIQELTVQTLRIGDKVCVDDVCLGKEEFKTLLKNAGGTSSATSISASNTTSTSTTLDTEPPVITILGNNPAELSVGSSYIDPGATVSDNRDSNLGVRVSGDAFATDVAGMHTVTYVATDASGNTATSTRQVTVVSAEVVASPAVESATSTTNQ
ncbi:MAG: tail fiber domain-containing protein [Patescibacteria group bacterium]